jgi:hypothetical protein
MLLYRNIKCLNCDANLQILSSYRDTVCTLILVIGQRPRFNSISVSSKRFSAPICRPQEKENFEFLFIVLENRLWQKHVKNHYWSECFLN